MGSWQLWPESQKSGFSHKLQANRGISPHVQNSLTLFSGHSLSVFSKSVLCVCEPGRRKLKSKDMPALACGSRLKCIGDALYTQQSTPAKIRNDAGFQDSGGNRAKGLPIPNYYPGKRPCTADTKLLLKPLFISVSRPGTAHYTPRQEPLPKWHISALPIAVNRIEVAKFSRLCFEKRAIVSLWRLFSAHILEIAARPCPAEVSFLSEDDSTHVARPPRRMFLQHRAYARSRSYILPS